MPLIHTVGRKAWKTRLLMAGIHLALAAGAATMVYPVLMLLSGSIRCGADHAAPGLLPAFLHDDAALFRKHLLEKFNGDPSLLADALFHESVPLDAVCPPALPGARAAADFQEFIRAEEESRPDFPDSYCIGGAAAPGFDPSGARLYRDWLVRLHSASGGLRAYNLRTGDQAAQWIDVSPPSENAAARLGQLCGPAAALARRFKAEALPGHARTYYNLDGMFAAFLRANVSKDLASVNSRLGTAFRSWRSVALPARAPTGNPALAERWEAFVRTRLGLPFITVSPEALPRYRRFVEARCHGDIALYNSSRQAALDSFDALAFPSTRELEPGSPVWTDWEAFIKGEAPVESLGVEWMGSRHRRFLEARYSSPAAMAREQGMAYPSFADVPLPRSPPRGSPAAAADWHAFADTLAAADIRLDRRGAAAYRDFIAAKYSREDRGGAPDYGRMSEDYGTSVESYEDIPTRLSAPGAMEPAAARTHYQEAVRARALAPWRLIADAEGHCARWRAFLRGRYSTIDALNSAWGLAPDAVDAAPLPLLEWEWSEFQKRRARVRWEFISRNYKMVWESLAAHGAAAWNTLAYCALAVAASLAAAPPAGYALSRLRPPGGRRLLLVLMLGMAFPSVVTGLPQFLLLRQLGLLNSYWALVLPGVASGYGVFLMKCFFDSIPPQLYEAAAVDGAGELRIFWTLSLALSKPILSIAALGAFASAYGNFMMALLVCQDKSMWTVMVYLHQLQQTAHPAVAYAALAAASAPTLLAFLLCQRMVVQAAAAPFAADLDAE